MQRRGDTSEPGVVLGIIEGEADMNLTKEQWLAQYNGRLSDRDLYLLGKAYDVLRRNTVKYDNAPWGKKVLFRRG